MKKKHKKIIAVIIAVIIVIIFAFFVLLCVKIIPSVLVSKTISAIDSNDVSAFKKYYDKLDYYPFDITSDSGAMEVLLYLEEQETDVADEINEKFQNFESTSEIEKYVKDNYPLLYRCCVKDNLRGTIIKDRIDSKQKCIELNEKVEELSQSVENSKLMLAQYSQVYDADGLKLDLQTKLHIEATLVEWDKYNLLYDTTYGCVQDDLTYINKIKPTEDELRTDIEKIEQERDALNE